MAKSGVNRLGACRDQPNVQQGHRVAKVLCTGYWARRSGRPNLARAVDRHRPGGLGQDLFDPYQTGLWKSISCNDSVPADQPCLNCNGEGYVVVRVYPWDGCSYDEKPCDLCNPVGDPADPEDSCMRALFPDLPSPEERGGQSV